MKQSLWVVVVIVVGIVGFLMGYSYSSFTGVRETSAVQSEGGKEEGAVAHPGGHEAPAGYGSQEPAAQQPAAPGGQAQAAGEKASPAPASPGTSPRRRSKPAAVTAGY